MISHTHLAPYVAGEDMGSDGKEKVHIVFQTPSKAQLDQALHVGVTSWTGEAPPPPTPISPRLQPGNTGRTPLPHAPLSPKERRPLTSVPTAKAHGLVTQTPSDCMCAAVPLGQLSGASKHKQKAALRASHKAANDKAATESGPQAPAATAKRKAAKGKAAKGKVQRRQRPRQ